MFAFPFGNGRTKGQANREDVGHNSKIFSNKKTKILF